MRTIPAECLLQADNELGEGPVWNPDEGALYWVDCVRRELLRNVPGEPEIKRWSLQRQPGSFAFCATSRLLLASRTGLGIFDLATGRESNIEAGQFDASKERFNDGKCDARGRFWTGTMDRALSQPVGSLYCVGSELTVSRVDAKFLTLSNGMAWSPDSSAMYLCDSRPGAVLRYDFDLDSGTLSNRRVFIDFSGQPGRPDGCTVDIEGGLWVAEIGAGRVARYDPSGRLERAVTLPISHPTSVAFGGARLDTLYITSMVHGSAQEQEPLAGALFVADPGVSGFPASQFSLQAT
jgi:sugar lactone lactonase YvrE